MSGKEDGLFIGHKEFSDYLTHQVCNCAWPDLVEEGNVEYTLSKEESMPKQQKTCTREFKKESYLGT
jgi:hypothetical protein